MKKTINIFMCMFLASCATSYHDGVSTWQSVPDTDEVLETQVYEKYVFEEDTTRQVESHELISDNHEKIDELNLSMSAIRNVIEPRVQTKTFKDKGQCFARLRYPARYVKTSGEVVSHRYEYLDIPAKYEWVEERVEDEISGETYYKKVRKLVSEARRLKRAVPAHKEVSAKVLRNEKTQLANVLCPEELTRSLVTKIQKKLKRSGYLRGSISGYMNSETEKAVEQYQLAKGLAVGSMTFETLNDLGIYSYSY